MNEEENNYLAKEHRRAYYHGLGQWYQDQMRHYPGHRHWDRWEELAQIYLNVTIYDFKT